MVRRILLILAWTGALIASPACAQPEIPELTGRVVDAAEIIPTDVEVELTTLLETLESETERQLVVTTIPDLQGYDIADYGYQLGRTWGIGDAERNDGALLIVAPNDRQVRIEVGYGLEGTLTDAYSSHIIQTMIVPRFRDGDMTGGIIAGTNALVAHLGLSKTEAIEANRLFEEEQSSSGAPLWLLPVFLFMPLAFILFIVFLAKMSGAFNTMPSQSRNGVRVATYSSSGSSWSSSSSSSFSSSSFSGGGGSFGGGGASGSW
ncbi:MAG: TPM domain-containing protein [Pseudomonadota bacterium]